ncbi:hypothetical protein C2E23DRAFT_885985 [Lenzites betulinus]|nr:hypothetical protein C2E23DRAFT_885985 [Lenzites betulinus]
MSSSGDFHQYDLHNNRYHLDDYDANVWPRALEDRFVGSPILGLDGWTPAHPRFVPRTLGEGSQSMEFPLSEPHHESSGHTDDFYHHQPDTYASDAFEAEYVAGSSSFDREWATRHGEFSMQSVELPLDDPPSPKASSSQTWESASPRTESFAELYQHYVTTAEGFVHPTSGPRSGEWSQSAEVPFPADEAGHPAPGTPGSPPSDVERSSEGHADVEPSEDAAQPSRGGLDLSNGEADGVLPTSTSSPSPGDSAPLNTASLPTTRIGVKEWLRRHQQKLRTGAGLPRTPVLFTMEWYRENLPGIALVDAEAGRVQDLRGFDRPVPLVGSGEDRVEPVCEVTLSIKVSTVTSALVFLVYSMFPWRA